MGAYHKGTSRGETKLYSLQTIQILDQNTISSIQNVFEVVIFAIMSTADAADTESNEKSIRVYCIENMMKD